jgi:hypothetical protein
LKRENLYFIVVQIEVGLTFTLELQVLQ